MACGFWDFIDDLLHGEFLAVIKSDYMSALRVGTQCGDDGCAYLVCAFV